MNINALVEKLLASTRSGACSDDAIFPIIENWVADEKVNFDEIKKTLLKQVKSNELFPGAASSVATWMIERGGKEGRLHGEKLLRNLASMGDAISMLNLVVFSVKNNLIKSNGGEFIAMCNRIIKAESMADQLKIKALSTAGDLYANFGTSGRPMFDEAIKCYESAAALGSGADAFIAGCYHHGKMPGRPQINFSRAAKMYAIGVQLGDVKSQTNLGLLHMTGAIPDFDESYGESLLRKSIADGDDIAAECLESVKLFKEEMTFGNSSLHVIDTHPENSDAYAMNETNDVPEFTSCMEGDEFSEAMPNLAKMLERAYLMWLERKNWGIGEYIRGGKQPKVAKWTTAVHYISHCMETWKANGEKPVRMNAAIGDLLESKSIDGVAFSEAICVALVDEQWSQLAEACAGEIQNGPKGGNMRIIDWHKIVKAESSLEYMDMFKSLGDSSTPLSKTVNGFLRRLLLKKLSTNKVSWFFERPCDVDGFRECNPGYPGEPHLDRGVGKLLSSDGDIKTVWASNTERGVGFTPKVQCTDFHIERINRKSRFVSVKIVGEVYGSKSMEAPRMSESDVLQTAYAHSQYRLLDMVSAMGCGIHIDELCARPFAVVECIERNKNGQKGKGIEVLFRCLKNIKMEWPRLQHVLFKVQPLQYSALKGVEPDELMESIRADAAKIIAYFKKHGIEEQLGIKMMFYTPYLSGDLADHLRDTRLSSKQKHAISMGMHMRGMGVEALF